MIKGLRTVIYPVGNLEQAKTWYAQAFGCEPTFDQPFYVGFTVGGFELGLVPDGAPGAQGSIAYWGVDDIDKDVARIVELGAKLPKPIQDVGDNIRVAELEDPFGNLLGLIFNPHFDPAAVK